MIMTLKLEGKISFLYYPKIRLLFFPAYLAFIYKQRGVKQISDTSTVERARYFVLANFVHKNFMELKQITQRGAH